MEHPLAGIFLVAALTTVLSSLLSLAALRWAQHRGVMAIPEGRSSHDRPTPSGGGAGLIAAMLIGWAGLWLLDLAPATWLVCIIPSVAVLAIMGWVDDRSPLSPWLRLAVQALLSFSVLVYLLLGSVDGTITTGFIWFALAWPSLVWLSNLNNFMDGSNGLAATQGIFATSVLAVLFFAAGDTGMGLIATVIAAACAGFLPLNFPRPRVFMGDVGSVPLGFAIGIVLVSGLWSRALPATALLVMGVFIVDATLTLLLRVVRRERWYTPHRQHVYQRLIRQGWSHCHVLCTYQVINLVAILPAVWAGWKFPSLAWPLTILMGLLLAGGWFAALSWLRQAHDPKIE